LEEDHLMDRQEVEDLLMAEIPQTQQETRQEIRPGTPELEEGEIPQTLEEGEILLTADSPIS
jgi:hypothetical protein